MIANTEIERARAVKIQDEIERRGITLKRQGSELVGPCPVCGGTDRFAVNIRKRIWYCRKCDVGGDVIILVQHLDGRGFKDAITVLAGDGVRTKTTAPPKPPKRHDDEDERRNFNSADAIWRAASALGPEGVDYFATRGININQAPAHGGLRFHPRCPWQDSTKPCIIGRFTTALGNEPRGIWRRPITGEKPIAIGPMSGCVIRLWPDEAVEQGLVIGEGVETVLSAATRIHHKGTLLQPAWAVCTAGNLENFPVLSGIEALTVLADNDASGTGQKAAAICAARWSAGGREVIRLTPKVLGEDFNNVVLRHD
jgi:phage/plasmid primase-like uncharacterized protein